MTVQENNNKNAVTFAEFKQGVLKDYLDASVSCLLTPFREYFENNKNIKVFPTGLELLYLGLNRIIGNNHLVYDHPSDEVVFRGIISAFDKSNLAEQTEGQPSTIFVVLSKRIIPPTRLASFVNECKEKGICLGLVLIENTDSILETDPDITDTYIRKFRNNLTDITLIDERRPDDYAGICAMFEKGITHFRNNPGPAWFLVRSSFTGLKEDQCTSAMCRWIEDTRLASPDELNEISEKAMLIASDIKSKWIKKTLKDISKML